MESIFDFCEPNHVKPSVLYLHFYHHKIYLITDMQIHSDSLEQTLALGAAIGGALRGGEVLELVSDVGGGKTAFTKGLGVGLGVGEVVQSPTFTISRIYRCDRGLELHHFDFYRLVDAGVMSAELFESLQQPNAITVVEWGEIVNNVLPAERVRVNIAATGENSRVYNFTTGPKFDYILGALQTFDETRKQA